MTTKLEDLSPMPWGKHKGHPMQDVPCGYLHYLWTTGKKSDKQCPVAEYIRANMAALKMENEDAIWD